VPGRGARCRPSATRLAPAPARSAASAVTSPTRLSALSQLTRRGNEPAEEPDVRMLPVFSLGTPRESSPRCLPITWRSSVCVRAAGKRVVSELCQMGSGTSSRQVDLRRHSDARCCCGKSFEKGTQPNAQMSVRSCTSFPRACSGLIYAEVPRTNPSVVPSGACGSARAASCPSWGWLSDATIRDSRSNRASRLRIARKGPRQDLDRHLGSELHEDRRDSGEIRAGWLTARPLSAPRTARQSPQRPNSLLRTAALPGARQRVPSRVRGRSARAQHRCLTHHFSDGGHPRAVGLVARHPEQPPPLLSAVRRAGPVECRHDRHARGARRLAVARSAGRGARLGGTRRRRPPVPGAAAVGAACGTRAARVMGLAGGGREGRRQERGPPRSSAAASSR
jgi:hypothetical protein